MKTENERFEAFLVKQYPGRTFEFTYRVVPEDETFNVRYRNFDIDTLWLTWCAAAVKPLKKKPIKYWCTRWDWGAVGSITTKADSAEARDADEAAIEREHGHEVDKKRFVIREK